MKLINITPQKDKASLIYHKPDTALLRNNDAFYLPEFSEHLSARLALVIRIKKMGKKITERFAHRYYDEISVGINIEASDLIEHCKALQLPWDEGVAFDYSAPIGAFVPKCDYLALILQLDGEPIQQFTSDDINIDQLITEVSHKFTLKIGDLIYLTLPLEGLKLEIDQNITCTLNGQDLLLCSVK
jgi:acylpyruvate hydrolase